eukprot:CFRG2025T1
MVPVGAEISGATNTTRCLPFNFAPIEAMLNESIANGQREVDREKSLNAKNVANVKTVRKDNRTIFHHSESWSSVGDDYSSSRCPSEIVPVDVTQAVFCCDRCWMCRYCRG